VQTNYSSHPDYWSREISPGRVYLHWRLLNSNTEIEVAVRARTQSWVGLGWRPRGLTTSCKANPTLASRSTIDAAWKAWIQDVKLQPLTSVSASLLLHFQQEHECRYLRRSAWTFQKRWVFADI